MPTSTYQTSPRTGITAADPDASKLPLIRCNGAVGIVIGGLCSVGGSVVSFSIIQLDATGTVVLAVGGPYTLTAGSVNSPGPANFGAQWLGTLSDSSDPIWHLACPQCVLKINSVTIPVGFAPVWTIGWGLAYPAGVVPT